MEMPLFFKFLYFWFLFGLLCSDLFIVWLNVRVWNGGEQQNEGRRLCRVTDFGAWRRGLLCFFCFFALFGSRDYEGKWRLGKQKGNIIKKKKSVKRNSLKKWHFFFFGWVHFLYLCIAYEKQMELYYFFEVGIFCLKGCVCVSWRFLSLVYWVSPRTVIEILACWKGKFGGFTRGKI